MTDRERWIVYPLLFFALGASLRDKILERVDTKQLVCESLLIRNPDGSGIPLAALRAGIDPTRLDGKPIAFLQVDKFLCEGLYIADEEDPTNILVSLGTGTLLWTKRALRSASGWGPWNSATLRVRSAAR